MKIYKTIIISIIFCLLCSVNVFADSVLDEHTLEEEGFIQEEQYDWVKDFKDIPSKELMEKVSNKDDVLSVARNSRTGSMYVVLNNSEKYRVTDDTDSLIIYLKVLGLDVSLTSFTESGDVKDTTINNRLWDVIGLGAVIGISVIVSRARKRRESSLVTVNKSKVYVGEDCEGIPAVRFSDVEGVEELKSDIMRLVDCLKNPKKYSAIGARIPKGVILYGPPGTGKTLLAKAIAGEAGVPFYSMCGSDFVEKYVGVGASRVRDLYKKARKSAPCIIFIDEIDAVASQRGNDENSERDQTINALLAELDGFKGTENVITICATNRLDMLDSAFKRAGRFDLKLAVGLPDKKGRERILTLHSKNKKLSDDVDLSAIALKTVDFSGAELEALLNESALVAVGKGKEVIDMEDIDDAFFKIVMQGNKKKRESISEVNKVVAWHESGHTLATKLLTTDSVSSVTIVGSSSGAGGVTFRTPKDDNVLHSKKYLESLIQVMYAGRAAEEIYFNDKDSITNGASQDIKQATGILKEYLSLYGMGEKGMIDISQFSTDFETVLDEASKKAQELYSSVLELLKQNYNVLKELSDSLLQKETLNESEIDAIIFK